MSHSPDTGLHPYDRTEFQLERIILFSDAVFAIAITLLIIEIKVPELHHRTEHEALVSLLRLIPKFVGFFIGFFVIATYWAAHHRIFRFVRHYNDGLIWLNIFFLLSNVLMPFTSAYYGEYPQLNVPFVLYCTSVIGTRLLQLRMQSSLANPKYGFVHPDVAAHPDLDPWRPLIPVSVFLLGIILVLTLPSPWFGRFVPILIFPFVLLYGRRYRRLLREFEARQPLVPTH
ncbi:hypothetical protein AUC43_07180 [Hymenobacter sedentarius]|uniref:DUF1211 domain-containing protein n=1 Tax=Hymenobacter sedentarius TaxID=1411621 RepID=A0A0U4BE82_9BACT|nr:TMEM175 family protein [Hymenobacter sedentarius]ALW84891.1 hypothetical protein AUC43_07180 [Hymenobacter sedentarius]